MSELALAPNNDIVASFDSARGFELLQRMATMFAKSSIVPKDFQNNLPNCVIAIEMAQRIGASPLMTMQNMYIVYGRPSWSAQFLIACFNKCGRFSSINYEFVGVLGQDDYGCYAYATELASGQKIRSTIVTIDIAKKEGWYSKNGSKWQSLPELMLRYRAATFLVRTYAPELTMGLQTAEELHDITSYTDVEFIEDKQLESQKIESQKLEAPNPELSKKGMGALKNKIKAVDINSETGEVLEQTNYKEAKYIICPKLEGTDEPEVYSTQCQNCSSRSGCPAWED